MSPLEIRGLVAGYGAARVLHEVDLRVDPGEIVGLAGRNGAGKSTLLRAISGLIHRRAQRLTVDDEPLPNHPASVARRGIAHIPEGRGMLSNLTAMENIRLGALATSKTISKAWLDEVITRIPRLQPLLGRRAGNLSGGEQQLVAIARAVVGRPRFVLADELSLGLAPRAAEEVFELAMDVCSDRGVGLLVVDQNIRTLARACHRVYVLRHGRAVELPPADAARGQDVESVYL